MDSGIITIAEAFICDLLNHSLNIIPSILIYFSLVQTYLRSLPRNIYIHSYFQRPVSLDRTVITSAIARTTRLVTSQTVAVPSGVMMESL